MFINHVSNQAKTELGSSRSIEQEGSFIFLIPKFIDYLKYEIAASPQTIAKYQESLSWIVKELPYINYPSDFKLDDITHLKKRTMERGCGPSRVNSFIFSLRKFLTYCKEVHKLLTLNPREIKPMKIPKRQVTFLTREEINQLLNSLKKHDIRDLRMRALMELLIASGARISEALSLNRDSINPLTNEATIIGKGNKERVIFVTPRAIEWLNEYLNRRKDDNPALFVTFGTNQRLKRYDLGKEFRRYAARAGIKKMVTPHLLRHSMATLMLHNGANIMDIQNLLGHADIKTTAQYYLGTDKRALKSAHEKFLNFDQ